MPAFRRISAERVELAPEKLKASDWKRWKRLWGPVQLSNAVEESASSARLLDDGKGVA
jgi:hypothetical protein